MLITLCVYAVILVIIVLVFLVLLVSGMIAQRRYDTARLTRRDNDILGNKKEKQK